ncbi:hypothetical protein L1049_022883 [Liquidambar formosana]|uniref:GAGA-binding transcriptional activator n=1 Tax=Liquidambar formosana TaxID=63359 RepID=A0AAP0RD77_LIQFO
MATFPNRNPMMSEANTEASMSHFSWFHPGSFLSVSRTSFNPLQATKINSEPGLPIAPIRSVAPEAEPAKNVEFVTKKPTKARKQKPSMKSSNDIASNVLRPKQPKKNPSASKKSKGPVLPAARREKKNLNIVLDGTNLDFSGVPSPVCSCTGVPRVCYKWGAGGWQSSCCTTSISEYPLPMSSSRPGSRMAGRKMSNGAYGKLLLRLAAEGHDLNCPVDLKNHWARHGTNKFVTIK